MATLLVAMSFKAIPSAGGKLSIVFDHYVDDKILLLDTVQYKNELGQPFTVTKLRYYIGNIHLKKTGGPDVIVDDYYLIDEEEPLSKKIILNNIPSGEYTGIDFIIGVDSIHNCSGAQSGALDPVNAMFWAWNTGYIFLKLEGLSNASKSSGHMLEYHIGGYKAPANCIRRVHIDIAGNVKLNKAHDIKIALKVDIAKLFGANNRIDFTKLSSVTDFHNATIIADNYSQMFSMISLN